MKFLVVLIVTAACAVGCFVLLKGSPPEVVSKGEYVYFGDHLEGPGNIVVFQFAADWCGPCQQIKPQVNRLIRQYANVHYKLVDVGSWETPAARQMSDELGGKGIPFFIVYDGDGDALALGHIDEVRRALDEHARG